MDFRAPAAAKEQNADAVEYLTKNLQDQAVGKSLVAELLNDLGNVVAGYPDWHPIITAPSQGVTDHIFMLSQISAYNGIDHTVNFVRGFVSCPYADDTADKLVEAVNNVAGLYAYRLPGPLYSDHSYPVVVVANQVDLEADGTIRSRDALAWFAQQTSKEARRAQVAETWWNIRSLILGRPHGSSSSLFVNQHTGVHMRKILEAMNNSGMFGPIKESSLEMLSQKKLDTISETLIHTAFNNWDKGAEEFEFELRGERCKASCRDTWNDGHEISIRVEIGKYDLLASGYYFAEGRRFTYSEPMGKRALAEKFL